MKIVLKESKHCKLILLDKEEMIAMGFLPEDFKPEKIQDTDGNELIKGAGVAVLEKIERQQGAWDNGDPKDQYNFQWRLETLIEGNASPNRVVFKRYDMLDGEYSTGAENRAKLIKDLCTAGYDVDYSDEDSFHASVPKAKGVKANLRLGIYKKGEKEYQTVRVVEKIKVKGGKKEKEEVKENDGVPF